MPVIDLGLSPCPNDTFIFDALIHHKIDTEGLDFEVFYDDVETLNQKETGHVFDRSFKNSSGTGCPNHQAHTQGR
jgi:predicted solute-binding protein